MEAEYITCSQTERLGKSFLRRIPSLKPKKVNGADMWSDGTETEPVSVAVLTSSEQRRHGETMVKLHGFEFEAVQLSRFVDVKYIFADIR